MGVETVALAAAGGQAAGGVIQGVAAFRQGQMQQRLAERQADMYRAQADIADAQGRDAALRIRRTASVAEGKQTAALAAQGIDVGAGGTAEDLLSDTARFSEEDARTARLNAARQAWGLRGQATITNAQGDFAMEQARTAMYASFLGGGAQSAGTLAK